MTRRRFQFPGSSWSQIEALPEDRRRAVHRLLTHLMHQPVPNLAEPYPPDDPLPGLYELHLPADGVTIWYVVTHYQGVEVISIQAVHADP